MMPDEERSGDLLDVALADEIELVSDLVVAASSSPRHFTLAEVDALLGISETSSHDRLHPADESAAVPETPTADGSRGTGPTRADCAE